MKFSPYQLRKLGLEPSFHKFPCELDNKPADEFRQQVLSKFSNVIKVLFSSDDGGLDNDYLNVGSEHTHPDANAFLANWLLKPVTPLSGCSTYEEAFDMIIPRNAQTSAELAPYIEKFGNIVKSEFESRQSTGNNEKSD